MSVILTWRSSKELEIGGVGFTNNLRGTQTIKGVASFEYSKRGVAGETDGLAINFASTKFHDLPVNWDGPAALIQLPHERLVLFSLPETLEKVVRDLGGVVQSNDLWVASLEGGNAQVGKRFYDSFSVVTLGQLGLLTIVPNKIV